MERKATNILEGEASESDEEVSDNIGYGVKPVSTELREKSEGPSSSVVVSGEASESDEEDETTANMMLTRNFPTLVSHQGLQDFDIQDENSVGVEERRHRFESPFHRAMWSRNFSLRLGIVRQHIEQYDEAFTKLKNVIPHSNRSQNYAQETLKHYRNISVSSKQLNDNLENLLRQRDLPQLKTPFPT